MIPKFSYIFLYISRMFVTWVSKIIKREVFNFFLFLNYDFSDDCKKNSMAAEPLLKTVAWFTLIFPSSMSLVIRPRLQLPTPTHIMTSNVVWPYCNFGLPSWKQGSEKLFCFHKSIQIHKKIRIRPNLVLREHIALKSSF